RWLINMRHILHADFDAFYTSIEQLDKPHLRGKPVVVGGSPEGRGVVASASYESRRFGIRSAMPMRTALRLCPDLIRVGARFDRYREVSRRVMAIFREITPLVEPLSLDEAYLDVTASVNPGQPSADIARKLKDRVKAELGLTISVGVGTSKSIAKIASDMDKPDGLTIVPPGSERDFLSPLAVGKLWGVGPKTVERLDAEGIQTIGDMASQPEDWFSARFGKTGPHMRSLSLGQDDRPVVVERETKSVSAETTLAHDTGDPEVLQELVSRLSQSVASDLRRKELQGRTVKLKLRLADFTTFTRQKTVDALVESSDDITQAASALLQAELLPGRMFRLVGVGVSGFDHQSDDSEHQEAYQPRLTGFE
ncbi:MAG: DNA polymerase IV, partial [Chloroflexi bacterium]|nr:DNA polymerase IV [Chloroflexota bacterium]